MHHVFPTKHWRLTMCLLFISIHMVFSVRSFSDYENMRELYELLMQRPAASHGIIPAEISGIPHQVIRKSSRSPQVRLRFGKKADPFLSKPEVIANSNRILEENEK